MIAERPANAPRVPRRRSSGSSSFVDTEKPLCYNSPVPPQAAPRAACDAEVHGRGTQV